MDKSPMDIEEMHDNIDFSSGHEKSVWDKVLSRLETANALSFDELDDVAGGLLEPSEKGDKEKKPPGK